MVTARGECSACFGMPWIQNVWKCYLLQASERNPSRPTTTGRQPGQAHHLTERSIPTKNAPKLVPSSIGFNNSPSRPKPTLVCSQPPNTYSTWFPHCRDHLRVWKRSSLSVASGPKPNSCANKDRIHWNAGIVCALPLPTSLSRGQAECVIFVVGQR